MYNVYLILPSWHVDLPHNYCSSYNCSALGSDSYGGVLVDVDVLQGVDGMRLIERCVDGMRSIERCVDGMRSIERCVDGTDRSRDVWMVPIDREMCGWYRKKNERCLSAAGGISSQVHTNTCQCQLTMMGSRSPTNYLLGIQLFPTRPCHTTHFGIPYHTIKPPVGQDTIPHSITAN